MATIKVSSSASSTQPSDPFDPSASKVSGDAQRTKPQQGSAAQLPNFIHLVDGEKGGVGKTMFARTLVQWFIDNQITFRAAEADRSNSDLMSTYTSHTQLVIVSENERLSGKTDGLFQMAAQCPVVVDLPAQAFRPISDWIERNDLIAAGAEHGIAIAKWFVSNGSYTSIKQFEQTLKHFKHAIPHVLVRNLYARDDWSAIDAEPEFRAMLEKYRVKVIDLPKLNYDERDLIDEYRLSFGAALEGDKLTVLQKTRVRKFLKAVYGAIEATGLLPLVHRAGVG